MMATNRIGFEARTPDGRIARVFARDYCDVQDEWFIRLEPARQTASSLEGNPVTH
jgi:hypothetical protein